MSDGIRGCRFVALLPCSKKVLVFIPSQWSSAWSLQVLPVQAWVFSRYYTHLCSFLGRLQRDRHPPPVPPLFFCESLLTTALNTCQRLSVRDVVTTGGCYLVLTDGRKSI
ncbi:hypothetical protein CHARACLAT_031880 [Characodon lateralis]|uniref:Uncharacterized protein n=1 Tax=Characodon lateralis TaxID=208331 RepID=A0ABU7F8S3_9TELE|nr:hypothetical protein [Characodon lateralis]